MDISGKELTSPEVDHVNKSKARQCTMCTFVLVFIAVVLLLLIFAFVFRSKTAVPVQIPTQTTRPISPVEMDQRINDLKDAPDASPKILPPRDTNPTVLPR
jgi:hypothetical protein